MFEALGNFFPAIATALMGKKKKKNKTNYKEKVTRNQN